MAAISLNTGLKALLTAQAGLDVIGHNVANANTPGYSRQALSLSSAMVLNVRGLGIGSGVHADVVQRTVDALIQQRLVSQVSSLSTLQARLGGMTEIQALLGEPGGAGLGAGLGDFFTHVSELSSSPTDLVLRTGLAQSAAGLAGQINALYHDLGSLKSDTAQQIGLNLGQVNSLAQELVGLNVEVGKLEATGVPANDLRDKRDEVLKELAGYVDLSTFEGSNGIVRVSVGGQLLVGETKAYEMKAHTEASGDVTVTIGGSDVPVKVLHGTVAGLDSLTRQFIPGLQESIDQLAHNLILEMNRVHSTGIPQQGYLTRLTSDSPLQDMDGDGEVADELLADAGLPFDVSTGDLYVHMTHVGTGAITTHPIHVDAGSTTVQDFLDELNAIPGMNAMLDGSGRVQLDSDSSYGFDFGNRLVAGPSAAATFGGGQASMGTLGEGPFALADGDSLVLNGSVTIDFLSADFEEISQATAEEIAAVVNADANAQAAGLRAYSVAGRLIVQTAAEGAGASLELTGGTALGKLGWTAGTVTTGADASVDPQVSGTFTGSDNGQLVFLPLGDGEIGTTAGLQVGAYDLGGQLVATLDVGDGYQPGTPLDVASGVQVSFGFGTLSRTEGDAFAVHTLADADTTDLLVALGLNGLFTGSGAADIALRSDIEADPSLLAASTTGAEGDGGALLELLALQTSDAGGLSGKSFDEFYGEVVGDLGFEVASAENSLEVEQFLFANLTQRRDQVSGVNVDEELVNMIQFEQAFQMASRYIQVVNGLNDELLSLI